MKIVTIGRSSSNDVNIDDNKVSRIHCKIIQDDNGNFTIIDVNSLNGTFVNGTKRHGEVRLNPNDIVRIGNTTLPWQSYFVGSDGGNSPKPPQPPVSKPNNFLAWAILSTIFCFIPFGIPSIVNASKVNNLWAQGDYNGAYKADRKARTWFWWSFILGLVINLFAIIYYAVVGVAIGMGY